MALVAERMDLSRAELQRLSVEHAEQESIIAARQNEIAALEQVRIELEQRLATGHESLSTLRQRREDAAQASGFIKAD